jgi:hypothetical protein
VFTNNGTFTQTTLLNFNTEATDGGLIQNTGTITAAMDATSSTGATSRIVNSGTINGNLRLLTNGSANNQLGGTWNGTALVQAGNTLTNAGSMSGLVTNAGALTSTGTLGGGLTNNAGGVADVSGTLNGAVSNTGTFTATGALSSNNQFTNNAAGRTTVNAGADWTGLTDFTNNSTQVDGALINGSLTVSNFFVNGAGANLRIGAPGTLNVLNFTSGGAITNQGVVNSGLTNTGAVTNEAGATWNGALSQGTGSAVNDGTWDGYVLVDVGGSVTNNGTWLNTANFGSAVNDGVFTNTGTWTGPAITATAATATLNNSGTMNGQVAASGGGTVTNSGTINGSATADTGGAVEVTSTGVVNGVLQVAAGSVGDNAGSITGLVTNAGDLTSTGTLGGGLSNTGTASLAGTANGAIVNQGSGTVTATGALTSTGVLVNQGSGTVAVDAGVTWSGLSAITNTSTAANGITVNGVLTTAGDLGNGAGSTVTVNNGGTINAGSVTNAATGTITVAQGGTINDDLNNSGIVSNAGASNADVNNIGATAVITNQTTGLWTGDVLTNASGAAIVNDGLWTGAAVTASTLTNSAGGQWTGAVTAANGGLLTNLGTVTGAVGSQAGGAITNQGTITGAVTNAGGLVSTGTITGGLSNSGSAAVRGTVNGPIANSGALLVNGALAGNGALSNTGSGTVEVGAGQAWSGLASVANTSTNPAGFIVNGSLTTVGAVTNAAGSSFLVNTGAALSSTAGITNSGLFVARGTVTSPFANTATGEAQAQGALTGAVTNAGRFIVTGGLSGSGFGFSNGATGQLINTGSSYSGLGAISNAAGGRIILGNGVTNATLSGTSLTNAGNLELMNGRVGDQVVLTGAFTAVSGSRVTLDINMALNTNQADRIVAASSSGTTVLSLQNVGASRTYFSQPIVLVSGGAGATFTAADDASTRAALASNGVVDYALQPLQGTNNWALISTVNTSATSSIAADTMVFVSLSDIGQSTGGQGLAAGLPSDGQGAKRIWGGAIGGAQDVSTWTTSSDSNASTGDVHTSLETEGFRIGGSLRVWAAQAGNLDVGFTASTTEGSVEQNGPGRTTRFEMPAYGAHLLFTGNRLRADVQVETLDIKIDPSDVITTAEVNGSGNRIQVGLGLRTELAQGTLEPYLRAEQLTVDIDPVAMTGGLGRLSFDSQDSRLMEFGLRGGIALPGETWSTAPSFDISITHEDGSALSRFTPVGVGGRVDVLSAREGAYFGAEAGVDLIHNASGIELYARGTGRHGEDVSGYAVNLGARLRF